MKLMRESLVLIAIGIADLISTLILLSNKGNLEGNPLMSFYLQFGIGVFVIVKLGLLFLPVFVAEWSKLHSPKFVRWMLRGAITLYLGSYVVLFIAVNVAPLAFDRMIDPPAAVHVAEKAR
jgi:hypothetical protein